MYRFNFHIFRLYIFRHISDCLVRPVLLLFTKKIQILL